MAERQEKTEQPTGRRLSKARQSGQLPQSQELLSAATLISLTAVIIMKGDSFVNWAMAQIREGFSCDTSHLASAQAFQGFIQGKMIGFFVITAPFFLVLMVTGVASSIAISGYNFTLKPLKWKFSTLNPIKGFTKLISVNSLVKLLLSIVKLVFIGLLVYFYVRNKLPLLATFQWVWPAQFLGVIAKLILGALIRLCMGILVIGFVDLAYQKWKYIHDLKMTKQEVKDERKSEEGPPEVKKRIRSQQFKLAMQRMIQDVPKANVVLVNPTHYAVAIKYDPDTMAAPVVVAKGKNHVCEKIKEVARAYGVPIIRRPAIARSLHASVDIGKPIPDSLFVAVAEVMALVYRLRNRR